MSSSFKASILAQPLHPPFSMNLLLLNLHMHAHFSKKRRKRLKFKNQEVQLFLIFVLLKFLLLFLLSQVLNFHAPLLLFLNPRFQGIQNSSLKNYHCINFLNSDILLPVDKICLKKCHPDKSLSVKHPPLQWKY